MGSVSGRGAKTHGLDLTKKLHSDPGYFIEIEMGRQVMRRVQKGFPRIHVRQNYHTRVGHDPNFSLSRRHK